MQFLTEETAPVAIREILKDATLAKIAVAFWGDGAVARLGIGRNGLKAKVICNLQSGACNPIEIRRLLALKPNIEVHTNARLHAKVYWTQNGAIVGSSNASTNGLAVEGRALGSWAEGNILVNDASVLGKMSNWFDQLFDLSGEITEADLAKAEEAWNNRSLICPTALNGKQGLLETYRKTSEHLQWERTKVAYCQDDISYGARMALAALQHDHPLANELSTYENWEKSLKEGDWVFDVSVESPNNAEYQDVWRILPYAASAPTLSLAMKSKKFNPDAFGVVKVTKDDKEQLASAAKHFISKSEDKRNALVTIAEVVAYLDRRAEDDRPSLARFEEAMRNIYFEAKSAGYTASAFWSMLQSEGALNTARRLALAPRASEGFTQLYLLGRLDLTVEALIVQEPWRRLFTPDVLAAAQTRLDQLS